MIDEKKQLAIDLLIEGKMNKSAIAKRCGKSRQWLYDSVINDNESKVEMDRRLQEIKSTGISKINSNIGTYIEELERIALTGKSERNRVDALQYLLNRVYGTPTAKTQDVTDKEDQDAGLSVEELQEEFKRFTVLVPEEKQSE